MLPDGVRLHRRMHVPIEGSDEQILNYLNLCNAKATVARFFIDDEFPEDYVKAEAIFYGEFNQKAFTSFLEHWLADILPVPDSIEEVLEKEALQRKKYIEEICTRHQELQAARIAQQQQLNRKEIKS